MKKGEEHWSLSRSVVLLTPPNSCLGFLSASGRPLLPANPTDAWTH